MKNIYLLDDSKIVTELLKFDLQNEFNCKVTAFENGNDLLNNIYLKPDIIILEGWCVGAKAQSDVLLKKPVNDLEKFEDPNLIWRKYVNKLLRTNYKKLFNKMNGIIYLKAPSFSLLKKWRFKQEKKLKFKNRFKKNLKIMSYLQILRFMMFYQRITLQMFKDLPKAADVILHLNEKHRIKKIQYNT